MQSCLIRVNCTILNDTTSYLILSASSVNRYQLFDALLRSSPHLNCSRFIYECCPLFTIANIVSCIISYHCISYHIVLYCISYHCMLMVVRNTLGCRFPKGFILLFDFNRNVRVADDFKGLYLQNTLKSITNPFEN